MNIEPVTGAEWSAPVFFRMTRCLWVLSLVSFQSAAFCFDDAGRHYHVDPDLLRAVAIVESGLNPFHINERTVLQPCLNVSLGAWILASNFSTHGRNWESVGAYNAGFGQANEAARQRYIQRVKRVYRQLKRRP